MNKRLIIIFSILLVFIGAGVLVASLLHSKQKLNITFPGSASDIKATIYRVTTDNQEVSPEQRIDKSKPIVELTTPQTISLKKGNYVLVTSGGVDYKKLVLTISLDKTPQTIEINPDYTEAKLGSLLASEGPALLSLIAKSFPGVIDSYEIGAGKLYERGEWYGTTLRLKQTEEQKQLEYTDIYRLVARKDSGVWKLVTNPPELIVNVRDYPKVPKSVLVDVNKQ